MAEFFPVYIYLTLILLLTLAVLGISAVFTPYKTSTTKYMPYESGMQTQTHLFQERFPLQHYLVALVFLIFDIETIFLYPWAVVAKTLGPFAFYEMAFFVAALLVGFSYVWQKGGLEWE